MSNATDLPVGLTVTTQSPAVLMDDGWRFRVTDKATHKVLAEGTREEFREKFLGIPKPDITPGESIEWFVQWFREEL